MKFTQALHFNRKQVKKKKKKAMEASHRQADKEEKSISSTERKK